MLLVVGASEISLREQVKEQITACMQDGLLRLHGLRLPTPFTQTTDMLW